MMDVVIYHNPRCSKSLETLRLIEARGIHPTVIEYLKTPPSVQELERIVTLLGVSPRALLRKGDATVAGIEPEGLSDAALLQAMVEHPEVIERPVVVANGKAALGRPPEAVLGILG